eukprot:Ihof_evm2s611 gene=Ihof_evmTU2s611
MTERSTFKPRNMQLDPDVARELFEIGGKLMFLDVPEGTEVGLDYNAWQVGPQFRGVKFIPPGVHFIYYSAADKTGAGSPRTGFFYVFEKGEVVVRQWNTESEDAEPIQDKEQESRLRLAVREFDPFLGTYPLTTHHTWVGLSNYITANVTKHLQPASGKINSVQLLKSEPGPGKFESNLVPDPEYAMNLTPIPRQSYPPGADSGMITKCNMDKSWLLTDLLAKHYGNNPKRLLGEIQFSFVCFLLGQSHEAFEQWKVLVALMCGCDDALVTMPNLFCDFIDVLDHQLKETPEDLFVDIVTCNNFLAVCLQRFLLCCNQPSVPHTLVVRAEQFKQAASLRFG